GYRRTEEAALPAAARRLPADASRCEFCVTNRFGATEGAHRLGGRLMGGLEEHPLRRGTASPRRSTAHVLTKPSPCRDSGPRRPGCCRPLCPAPGPGLTDPGGGARHPGRLWAASRCLPDSARLISLGEGLADGPR